MHSLILHTADNLSVLNRCKVLNVMIRKVEEGLRGYSRGSSTDPALKDTLHEATFTVRPVGLREQG